MSSSDKISIRKPTQARCWIYSHLPQPASVAVHVLQESTAYRLQTAPLDEAKTQRETDDGRRKSLLFPHLYVQSKNERIQDMQESVCSPECHS